MLELGRHLDFPEEAIGTKRGGQFRPEHLDRHLAVVLEILRQVDGGHAALAQFAFETEVIGESGGDAVKLCGHWLVLWGLETVAALLAQSRWFLVPFALLCVFALRAFSTQRREEAPRTPR